MKMQVAFVATLIAASATPSRADFDIIDTTGAVANWSLTIAQQDPGASVVASQEFGDYRRLFFQNGSTYARSIYTAATYDPGIQGALIPPPEPGPFSYTGTTLDYDQVRFSVGYLALQSGIFYNTWANDGYAYPFNSGGVSGDIFGDFHSENGDGSQPDFSAAGASIQFGYYVIVTAGQNGFDLDVNNFSLHLFTQAVPEPSSLLLVGLGSLALFRARQRGIDAPRQAE